MNNVGTSDDSQTQFANYDSSGGGASYSNQALHRLVSTQDTLLSSMAFVSTGHPAIQVSQTIIKQVGRPFLLQHQARTPWPSWDRPPMAPLQG